MIPMNVLPLVLSTSLVSSTQNKYFETMRLIYFCSATQSTAILRVNRFSQRIEKKTMDSNSDR